MIIYPKDLAAGIRCCGPVGCGEPNGFGHRYCIGEKCAAWEFGPQPRRGYRAFNCTEPPTAEPERPKDISNTWEWSEDDCGWIEPHAEAETRRPGWCGLLARRAES